MRGGEEGVFKEIFYKFFDSVIFPNNSTEKETIIFDKNKIQIPKKLESNWQ